MTVSKPLPSAEKDADGPECETCGKTTCPDADLPEFSEPRNCTYAPIYRALRAAKDCDYGCARDYTNQAVRLWVVEAVEQMRAEAAYHAMWSFFLRLPHSPFSDMVQREAMRLRELTRVTPPGGSDA